MTCVGHYETKPPYYKKFNIQKKKKRKKVYILMAGASMVKCTLKMLRFTKTIMFPVKHLKVATKCHLN